RRRSAPVNTSTIFSLRLVLNIVPRLPLKLRGAKCLDLQGANLSTSEQLIDAVSYSCINYVLWLPVVYGVESGELRDVNIWLYVLFYFLVLFVSPVAISYLWVNVRIKRFKQHPIQRPWDYVFSSLEPHWVLVTLKSGEKIGGYYGPNSFASSSPAPEQIFLQSSWVINEDEGFERIKETTAGVLILSSEILYLEFYKAD
ncbi:DUF6338 family protein, partial [Aeromonas caviae]|uniref:DUF6338 family protein n=1 Tax=Aeromonas caviae TaxID=648 RepID=UPI002E18FC04